MGDPKKNIKARERRRKAYRSALERKVMSLAEQTLAAQDEARRAVESEKRMEEAFQAVLNRKLVVDVVSGPEFQATNVRVRYLEQTISFRPFRRFSYNDFIDATKYAFTPTLEIPEGEIAYNVVIDVFRQRRMHDADAYLNMITRTMGNEIARAIVSKLLADTNNLLKGAGTRGTRASKEASVS